MQLLADSCRECVPCEALVPCEAALFCICLIVHLEAHDIVHRKAIGLVCSTNYRGLQARRRKSGNADITSHKILSPLGYQFDNTSQVVTLLSSVSPGRLRDLIAEEGVAQEGVS